MMTLGHLLGVVTLSNHTRWVMFMLNIMMITGHYQAMRKYFRRNDSSLWCLLYYYITAECQKELLSHNNQDKSSFVLPSTNPHPKIYGLSAKKNDLLPKNPIVHMSAITTNLIHLLIVRMDSVMKRERFLQRCQMCRLHGLIIQLPINSKISQFSP